MAKDTNVKLRKKSDLLRLTLLDFFIILLAVLCVLGIVFRSRFTISLSGRFFRDDCTVSFVARGINESVKTEIEKNLKDTLSYCDEEIGKADELSFTKEYCYVEKEKDPETGKIELEKSEIEGSYTLTGSVIFSGRYTPNGFFVNDEEFLTVGKTIELSGSGYSFTAVVTEIERK